MRVHLLAKETPMMHHSTVHELQPPGEPQPMCLLADWGPDEEIDCACSDVGVITSAGTSLQRLAPTSETGCFRSLQSRETVKTVHFERRCVIGERAILSCLAE